MKYEVDTLVVPRSRMSASISSRPFGSMPLVGSSRKSRSGSCTSAWASLMRCFMPVMRLHVAVTGLPQSDVVGPRGRAAWRRRDPGRRARRE